MCIPSKVGFSVFCEKIKDKFNVKEGYFASVNEIYNKKRKEKEGKAENFSQLVKDVKNEMKEQKIKGSYYDIAYDNLKEIAQDDSELLQDNKRVKMVENKSENVKSRLVKKELLENATQGDKISRQAIKDDKAGNKLTARKLDI